MLERAADGIDSDRAWCENPLMSYAIVRAEIERFLRSPSPEVLCISGRWGVGKTYSWQTFLREEETAGRLGVDRHAYVSLFGLNSLGELRSAIVENTVVAGGRHCPMRRASTACCARVSGSHGGAGPRWRWPPGSSG